MPRGVRLRVLPTPFQLGSWLRKAGSEAHLLSASSTLHDHGEGWTHFVARFACGRDLLIEQGTAGVEVAPQGVRRCTQRIVQKHVHRPPGGPLWETLLATVEPEPPAR